jgi:hypothetical protein
MGSTALRSETQPSSLVLSLPRDMLIQELAQWLHPMHICHIGATCWQMRWFLDENALWGRLVVSTYGPDWQRAQKCPNHQS